MQTVGFNTLIIGLAFIAGGFYNSGNETAGLTVLAATAALWLWAYTRQNGHAGKLPEIRHAVKLPEDCTQATEYIVHRLMTDPKFRDEFESKMRIGNKWVGPAGALAWLSSPAKGKTGIATADLLNIAVSQIDGDYIAKNWYKIVEQREEGELHVCLER